MGKDKVAKLQAYFKVQQENLEELCIRCGACCGAYDGDPCVHLKKDNKGKYYCKIYEKRLGKQKTVSGEEFECVSIWEIIRDRWAGDHLCAYKKKANKSLNF